MNPNRQLIPIVTEKPKPTGKHTMKQIVERRFAKPKLNPPKFEVDLVDFRNRNIFWMGLERVR